MARSKLVRYRPITYRAWRAKRVGSLVGVAVMLVGDLFLIWLVAWYWWSLSSRWSPDAEDVMLGAILTALALELLVVPAVTGAANLRAIRAGRDPVALAAAGRFARTGLWISVAAVGVVVAVDVVAVGWHLTRNQDLASMIFLAMGHLPVSAMLLSLPATAAAEIRRTDRITDLHAS